MYLTEVKKRYDCDEDCECKKCEMWSANDDQDIRVSVSPRRFELPIGPEKRAKMKIKNKNPYPIYFKASTSNMNVFRPLPIHGRIPPNKKVSVDVKFYDTAMPLRCHEEVIVLTSVKPIEQLALYKEHSCSYCMEAFDCSKHRRHSHADGYSTDPDHRSYKKNSKLSKYVAKEHEEDAASHYEDFEVKNKVPKEKMKIERDQKFREKKKTKKLQEEDEVKITKQARDYAQTYPKISDGYSTDPDHGSYKKNGELTKCKIFSMPLEHEECDPHEDFLIKYNVPKEKMKTERDQKIKWYTGQFDRRKLERYSRSEKQKYARERKSKEDDVEDMSKEHEEDGASHYEDFEVKNKVLKEKMKTEHDQKFREKEKTKKLQEEDEEKITKQARDYTQTYPKISHLDETVYKNRDYYIGKSKHTVCSHKLSELCIHALVHRPSASGCECTNCVELWTGKADRRKLERYSRSEKQKYAREKKSEEDDVEDRLYRTDKGPSALHQAKDRKDERKGKGREAHILARILRAERGKESLSDTDLTELISRGTLPKITKIISEEDYKKKKERLKKKLLKTNAEESESTTTEDTKNEQKGSDVTLKVLDEKCNTLINLSWANLFLMLLLMLTVVGSFTYCCRPGLTDRKYLQCLYDILQNYG